MLFNPELTPAQHVARREALTQISRGLDLSNGLLALSERVMVPLVTRFAAGHRLDGRRFESLVDEVRAVLTGFGPPLFVERRRNPTRARPKGEEHEFLLCMRAAADQAEGSSGYELAGIRIVMNRRRISLTYESNGIFITRHALERSIERGMASWAGRLAEVEDAMLDNMSLAIVWRHAYETGRTANPDLVLPHAGGLILGTFSTNHHTRVSGGISVSGTRADNPDFAPSALLAHPLSHAATTCIDTVLCTAVDEELLVMGQVDLRDALMRFRHMHRVPLADIRHSALWRTASIEPAPSVDDLVPVLDRLADELGGLLARSDAQEALRTRRRQPPSGEFMDRIPGSALPPSHAPVPSKNDLVPGI